MQAIREYQTVKDGKISLQLPDSFWGREVEIIVLPLQDIDKKFTKKKSLRGCLSQYAKPELMEKEKEAWQEAVKEKRVLR